MSGGENMGVQQGFEQVEIGRVKEYWDRRPCNVRHSTQPVGTKRYFDEVEARKYFVEPHIPGFAEFERWRGKKVLEIGCGIGTDTINFARHGAQVTCVDLSERSLEIARQRAVVYGVEDQVQFYRGNAEDLSTFLPVNTYDLIYSFGVVHHTPHPERVMEQLRHYAGPGTKVKIMVYHRRSWKVAWILAGEGRGQFWKLRELVARNSEAQSGCPITYIYTRTQGRELLRSGRFRATRVEVDHIFPYRIRDYVEYRYVKEWYFRWMPGSLFHRVEKVLGWHLCLDGEVA
jgi:2-polyprenyl-3-methyl-5-hydroxy-6-metoxy-1,4-benzoquinol methylase